MSLGLSRSCCCRWGWRRPQRDAVATHAGLAAGGVALAAVGALIWALFAVESGESLSVRSAPSHVPIAMPFRAYVKAKERVSRVNRLR